MQLGLPPAVPLPVFALVTGFVGGAAVAIVADLAVLEGEQIALSFLWVAGVA